MKIRKYPSDEDPEKVTIEHLSFNASTLCELIEPVSCSIRNVWRLAARLCDFWSGDHTGMVPTPTA